MGARTYWLCVNVTGDMWQYTPILEKIGIKVVVTLAGDGRVEDIQMAHRAKLNVIVCAKSLISLTRKMQERYNIPYISISFYGKRDTTNAIMSIVNAFGDEKLIKRAKEIIEEEETKLEKALIPYRKILENKKAILNTGGNKAWSMASALQDIGIEVVATSIRKCTLEDIEIAKKYVPILMKVPANEQAALIDEHGVDILLAGGRSLYTAIKKKVAFVDVNQEKKISYGAYSGLINLAKDVISQFVNVNSKEISIENIKHLVAEHFMLPVDKLQSKTRKRSIVIARQLSMYLAKNFTKNSLKIILYAPEITAAI